MNCRDLVGGGVPRGDSFSRGDPDDYLKAGDRIDDFLQDFPTVSREQVVAVLEIASDAVIRYARSA